MEDRGETSSISLCLTHSLRLPADTRQSTLGHTWYPDLGHRLEDPSSSLCNFPHRKCHPHLLYNFSVASNCGATHPRFPPSSSNDVPGADDLSSCFIFLNGQRAHAHCMQLPRIGHSAAFMPAPGAAISAGRECDRVLLHVSPIHDGQPLPEFGLPPAQTRCAVRCDTAISVPRIRMIWGMSRSTQFGGDQGPSSANITHYRSTLTIVGRPTRGMMTASFKPMKGGVERRIIPERAVAARPNHQSPRHLLSSNPPSGSGGKCWKPFVATNPARSPASRFIHYSTLPSGTWWLPTFFYWKFLVPSPEFFCQPPATYTDSTLHRLHPNHHRQTTTLSVVHDAIP
ncbi:hypothetical protein BDP81DRAFT_162975 [Colletotrichum phormii]|uniref:Uncharacterized protein n=1 Tax=Colletotrichum phormii TaxID=359342 RepID=A0AAJ0A0Q4_9PEZI|nr:uncharacterized protein BDP81DRAFT_162975 [Colletotrichum phormii]KAK1640413.1 hypothetical protein BDP81DRAFT_162975 [Colletotrichum phormii]